MYTDEQQQIIKTVETSTEKLFKLSAIAGSGKTHTLIGIAQALKPKKGLYIAFNTSVAQEARLKFPRSIECKTIHALAYQYVIKGSGQKVEELNIDSLKTKHNPATKRRIINAVNAFFNSAETTLSFIDAFLEPEESKIAKKLINDMIDGKMSATFGFIIKYFYLQLREGNIEVDYDLILLDEAGDLSAVTIEIFKLLKAPKKVMVGDPHQNIYLFMNTVNGFDILKKEGIQLKLSQSFRVETSIARRIEGFCHKWLSKDMDFRGVDIPEDEQEIKTRIYLSRTNAQLIGRMIQLNSEGVKYTTLRKPAEIFALPMALISISTGNPVYKSEYKYLERDKAVFDNDESVRLHYGTFHRYLRDIHGDDPNIITALRLLEQHSYKTIFETYSVAKQQPKTSQPITLATAFVSKGGTYDSVYIENDLNNIVERIILQGGPESEEDLVELNLYYVAATRCRLELLNANHL